LILNYFYFDITEKIIDLYKIVYPKENFDCPNKGESPDLQLVERITELNDYIEGLTAIVEQYGDDFVDPKLAKLKKDYDPESME
jgi:hypothetical protein